MLPLSLFNLEHFYAVLPALLFLAYTNAQPQCFFPDGVTIAVDSVPCNSSASNTPTDASACCSNFSNSYCLSTNLCLCGGQISRDSCTDKTWSSSACATSCIDEQKDSKMNIFQCHEVNSWQCEWGNCSSNFSITNNDWHVYLRDDQKASIGIANSAIASPTTVVSSTTATMPAVSSSGKTQQPGKSTDRQVMGLSIGLPVGVLLVVCLGLLYWRRQQLSKAEAMKKSCEELEEAERQAREWALKIATIPPQEMPQNQVVREMGNAGADSHELAGGDGLST